tara:strand:- start:446 stop:568 length:123 start_codon:yes stop_codon:yes gene_type:complete
MPHMVERVVPQGMDKGEGREQIVDNSGTKQELRGKIEYKI